jgi:hypothetical protein
LSEDEAEGTISILIGVELCPIEKSAAVECEDLLSLLGEITGAFRVDDLSELSLNKDYLLFGHTY